MIRANIIAIAIPVQLKMRKLKSYSEMVIARVTWKWQK